MKNGKTFSRMLSLTLSLLLIICAIPTSALVVGATELDVWDGTASDSLSGTGAENDPYLIQSAADLAYFASTVNGGKNYEDEFVALKADLVLNANASDYESWASTAPANTWTPIGLYNANRYFAGTFDGENHSISGLYVYSPGVIYAGLFAFTQGGSVKNLKVKDSYIAAGALVGGICGKAIGEEFYNCSFNGTVRALSTTTIGTLAAVNCVAAPIAAEVEGTLSAEFCCAGGLVIGSCRSSALFGTAINGVTATIKNSYSLADILVKVAGNYAGSIFGFAQTIGFYPSDITLINCYAKSTAYRVFATDPSIDKYERTAGTERNIALFGDGDAGVVLTQSNCYYSKLCNNGDWIRNGVDSVSNLTEISVADYAILAAELGNAFVDGPDGYPVFADVLELVKGDAHIDGVLNILDLVAMKKYLVNISDLTDDQFYAADLDNSGELDASDLTIMRQVLLGIVALDSYSNNDYTLIG